MKPEIEESKTLSTGIENVRIGVAGTTMGSSVASPRLNNLNDMSWHRTQDRGHEKNGTLLRVL